MALKTIESRVMTIERQVTTLATRGDVKAMSDQIRQLGIDLRAAFFALRDELRDRAGDVGRPREGAKTIDR